MSTGKKKPSAAERPAGGEPKVSFYPAWCKRCGNCVAFCPRQALQKDQWGYPQLPDEELCVSCGLCEKLCPDFAISVGGLAAPPQKQALRQRRPGSRFQSPERLTPPLEEEDK